MPQLGNGILDGSFDLELLLPVASLVHTAAFSVTDLLLQRFGDDGVLHLDVNLVVGRLDSRDDVPCCLQVGREA